MKNLLLFVFVIWFLLLGSSILVIDLAVNHSLHVMNGCIGGGLLFAAAALALPVQLDHVVEQANKVPLPFKKNAEGV